MRTLAFDWIKIRLKKKAVDEFKDYLPNLKQLFSKDKPDRYVEGMAFSGVGEDL